MSRVDDERDAARVAARLAEAKRVEEASRSKKVVESNTFSKLVQGEKKTAQGAQENKLARSAIAQLLDAAEVDQGKEAKQLEHGVASSVQEHALATRGQEKKAVVAVRTEGQRSTQLKSQEGQENSGVSENKRVDQTVSADHSAGRSSDAQSSRERLAERRASGEADTREAGQGVSQGGESGDLKADADKGGGQQQGGSKEGKDGGGASNPSFRFNPALMAPVPVAKTKDTSGSERLRKVANELAQKIVDKVRIGTNAAGKVEFQVDLRSDVLSGLSVKVSAHNGKISAVFQGTDKDVLKMIDDQSEVLKNALGLRGLTLEELKFEAR